MLCLGIIELSCPFGCKMKALYSLLIISLLFIGACKTAKPAMGSGLSPASAEVAGKGDNYILALVLKASRNPGDSIISFQVSNMVKKPGSLKPNQNDNSGTDYTVIFATEKEVPVQTYTIRNPLDTWVESSEETGKLQTTPMQKDEDFISVRTNYTPDMKKLIIKKNTADSNKIIIPLNIQ